MPSMAWTPIGVSPPHGVSSRFARHWVGCEEERVRERHRRLDVHDHAELARPDPLRGASSSPGGSAGCSRAPSVTPASRSQSTAASASALVSANGFSQKTCLPASAAATTCGACMECGVASTTASTSGSARSARTRRPGGVRGSAAKASTSGETVRVAPATKRISSLRPWTDSTSVLPHHPSPTMAGVDQLVEMRE